MEINGEAYKSWIDEEVGAKIDEVIDLTERLLDWLDEQDIDYSHIVREYLEEKGKKSLNVM